MEIPFGIQLKNMTRGELRRLCKDLTSLSDKDVRSMSRDDLKSEILHAKKALGTNCKENGTMAKGPTHRLIIKDKKNKARWTRAGVAWLNEKGWFSIRLNPGVTLRSEEMEDRFHVSLYPILHHVNEPLPEDGPPLAEEQE